MYRAYDIVNRAEKESCCCYGDPFVVHEVLRLRRVAVAKVKLVAPEYVCLHQSDREIFDRIFREHRRVELVARTKQRRAEQYQARKHARSGY